MSTVDRAGNNNAITAEMQAKLNEESAKSFIKKYDKDRNSVFSKAEQKEILSDQLHAKIAEIAEVDSEGAKNATPVRINEMLDSANFKEISFKDVDKSQIVKFVEEVLGKIRNFVAKIIDPLINSKKYDTKPGQDEKGNKTIELITYKNSDKRVADFRKPIVDVDGYVPIDKDLGISAQLYQMYPTKNE